MPYLSSTSVVVDAILTKKGRELLSRNDGSFRITQFSLSDDEVDYTLYNPNHPSGSAFYGEAIEAMPVLQAYPNDNEIMKYKLITLPRGTARLPFISIATTNISIKQGESVPIEPKTLNYLGGGTQFEPSGYIFTIGDVRLVSNFTATGVNTPEAQTANNATATIGTDVTKTVIGTTLNITGTTINTLFGSRTSLQTTLIITGRDSGARLNVPLTVSKTI
jgi:hypothetical protein